MGKKEDYSTIFGKIVLSKFDGMPEWVRVCAFLVALFVVSYFALHSVNARYFVTGTVLEPSPIHPESKRFGRGYDVRWTDKYAGTNSKGHFVFVLSPMEYFSLMKAGKQTLEIWKSGSVEDIEDQQICDKSITFERMEGDFQDYYIDSNCSTSLPATSRTQIDPPLDFDLLPTVLASQPAARDEEYRILVRALQFSPRWSRSDSAEIMLFQGGESLPLLNPAGDPYGSVSVLPGQSFAFAEGVYLPARSLSGGRVRLSDKRGIFNYEEEWFDLSSTMVLGKVSRVNGGWGSALVLIPIGRSTITIYRKYGDKDYYAQLTQDLLSAGVMPVSSASPMGPEKLTNTLFIGPAVPSSTVKSVVAAVNKNGVSLKRIAYPYNFTSTPETSRIQLGWSAQCVDAVPIPQSELATLAALPDDQVVQFLAKYSECKQHTEKPVRRR